MACRKGALRSENDCCVAATFTCGHINCSQRGRDIWSLSECPTLEEPSANASQVVFAISGDFNNLFGHIFGDGIGTIR